MSLGKIKWNKNGTWWQVTWSSAFPGCTLKVILIKESDKVPLARKYSCLSPLWLLGAFGRDSLRVRETRLNPLAVGLIKGGCISRLNNHDPITILANWKVFSSQDENGQLKLWINYSDMILGFDCTFIVHALLNSNSVIHVETFKCNVTSVLLI